MPNHKYDWPALLAEFERSGLTQTQFCLERKINLRYFNLQRSKRRLRSSPAFAQAVVAPVDTSAPLGSHLASASLTLQVGRCRIEWPRDLDLERLAALVLRLA
jgi:hypothetical protein